MLQFMLHATLQHEPQHKIELLRSCCAAWSVGASPRDRKKSGHALR
jgi:hypothetical protein